MIFSRWETKENMMNNFPLTPIDGVSEVKYSGLPMAYDDKYIYIDSKKNHSLVIGSTGSGKTQAITLPMLELACMAGESVVVHDTKSELYDTTSKKFKENGYNVIKINLDSALNSNNWNPFDLPYKIYKDGNKDKAQELIEDLAFYLLNDITEKNNDPFWINSAVNYFTGIVLYMFENSNEVNLNKLLEIDLEVRNNNKILDNIDKNSSIYTNLVGVLKAPTETKGSILSVFSDKIKLYYSKENLKELMSKSDFDITGVAKEKTIIYIITGNSNNSEHLLPLLISQIYFAKDEYSKDKGKISIIIDDFYELYPIKNFSKMLNYSRGIGIMYTIMIKGFNDLKNKYGKEQTEMIKMCFGNIMYLLSQDINTLEEISKLCGNESIINGNPIPLISVEELKTLKIFEAVLLIPRTMPFKTNLLPYYQIKK